jgi:hypothetical protein
MAVGAFAMPEIFDRIPNGGELTISTGLLATVSVSFVLGYFLFSVLAMFIGSVVSSAAEGQRQTGLSSLLVGLPAWLIGLILYRPDGTIAEILTYFLPTVTAHTTEPCRHRPTATAPMAAGIAAWRWRARGFGASWSVFAVPESAISDNRAWTEQRAADEGVLKYAISRPSFLPIHSLRKERQYQQKRHQYQRKRYLQLPTRPCLHLRNDSLCELGLIVVGP